MNVTGLIARRAAECARVDFLRPYRSAAGYGAALGETAGQRAYRAVPKLAGAFLFAIDQRIACLSSGGKTRPAAAATTAALADQLGVSRALLFQARQLHAVFAANPAARAAWEPQILRREHPLGLGAALRAITGGRPARPRLTPDAAAQLRGLRTAAFSTRRALRPTGGTQA